MHKLQIPIFLLASAAMAMEPTAYEYRLLATSKTATMEKEMNEAAAAGFCFSAVMGGETGFGGKEVVVIMERDSTAAKQPAKLYKLLATSKTSTMQKEMDGAGNAGFAYRAQTVFESAFGGREVAVILERDGSQRGAGWAYRLLATSRTSTMEKELTEAGREGFRMLGMAVGKTAMGGSEVVSILGKPLK